MNPLPVYAEPDQLQSPLRPLIELLAMAVQSQLTAQSRAISFDSAHEQSPNFSENPVDFKAPQSVYSRHQTGNTY